MTKRGLLSIQSGADKVKEVYFHFLQAHQAAYGIRYTKPKHHWAADLADQFVRDKCVLDAFVIERQHLFVKALADRVDRLDTYESSVLAGVVLGQVQRSRSLVLGDSLIGKTFLLPELPSAVVSARLSIHGVSITADDVVFDGTTAGIVTAAAQEADRLFLLVLRLRKVADITPHAGRYQQTRDVVVWQASVAELCLAWRYEPAGTLVVVRR